VPAVYVGKRETTTYSRLAKALDVPVRWLRQ
jgi:hypothetical protein